MADRLRRGAARCNLLVQGALFHLVPESRRYYLTEIDSGACEDGKAFDPLLFDGSDTLYVEANYQGYAALYRYDLNTPKRAPEPVVETVGFDFQGSPVMDMPSKRLLELHLTTDANTTVWFNPVLKAEQAKIDALLSGSINTTSSPADSLAAPVLLVTRQNDRLPTEYALYVRTTGKLVGLGSSPPTSSRRRWASEASTITRRATAARYRRTSPLRPMAPPVRAPLLCWCTAAPRCAAGGGSGMTKRLSWPRAATW